LRANGSRERAPEDKLHETIQKATKQDWIAWSLALLAMTVTARYADSYANLRSASPLSHASMPSTIWV
jgi:hypothetical protein